MDISSFQPTGDESEIEPPTATARGPERASRPDGPGYLGSPQYLEYRAKPARGIGKDGEIVWSDEIEDAFHQALKERDSQQRQQGTKDGSGRNEFIAQHIERLTGKTRTNKQVSSHLRHLDSFLKGYPDCKLEGLIQRNDYRKRT
ncbi:unnamed protein product [Penicillium salamii]|nr:unnamed protein product [Penicillium salamii]